MSAVVDPRDPEVAGGSGLFAPIRRPGSGGGVQTTVEQTGAGRQRLESVIIFVLFGVAYGLLGDWLVVSQHVFTFADLERLANAYQTWHGSPPKLAALGFQIPPITSVVMLPFAIVTGMAKSLVALPICSAIFGGLTMVAFNRLMDRCDMNPAVRYPVLLLNAAVPTIVFYSSGGGAEMISLWLLTLAVSALIAWFRTVDTRFLISSGLAFGFASMADYTNFVYMILAGIMVAAVLARHGADDAEVEGSVITYVAPALYALALWILINWLIVSSPFGWVHDAGNTVVNILPGHLAGHHASLAQAFGDSLRLALNAAPLSLVIAPVLIITAVVQRNELAGWLAAFTIVAIFRPGGEAILHSNIMNMQMAITPPQLLMALVGAGWLYQSFPDARAIIGGGLIVAMIATIVVVWHGMAVYPYQDGEQAFHEAVAHTSVKPTRTLGGRTVGIGQEMQMANYIDANVHAKRSILTDNSQTYGVILKTGRAGLFQSRLANGGSATFLRRVKTPPKGVHYFLIAVNDPADAIRGAYPNALSGRSGLSVIFRNSRYALVRITAKNFSQKNSSAVSQAAQSGGTGVVSLNGF